ncbi:hypothetical protein [Bradyrhizobium sp.]|uniref:hypothetical protein n=1 Tax=Bradyrhizobium sp. TaxID=376 RepID=UPI003BB007E6
MTILFIAFPPGWVWRVCSQRVSFVPALLVKPEFGNHFRVFCRAAAMWMVNSLMMLAVEANGVFALRMMKLIRGGRRARREAEKWSAKRYRQRSKLTQVSWLVLRAMK